MNEENKQKVIRDEYGRLYYTQEQASESPLNSYIEWKNWTPNFEEEQTIDFEKLVVDKGVNFIHEINQTILKTSDTKQQMGLLDVIADSADMLRRYLDNSTDKDD